MTQAFGAEPETLEVQLGSATKHRVQDRGPRYLRDSIPSPGRTIATPEMIGPQLERDSAATGMHTEHRSVVSVGLLRKAQSRPEILRPQLLRHLQQM